MVARLEQICAVKVGLLWLYRKNKSPTSNLSDLPISAVVCGRVEKVVENLLNYLRIWNNRYQNGRDAILSNPIDHIKWLADGKIDEMSTIRNVLDDDHIDINMRFQQCCYHSIVDRMEQLWIKLPRGSFYLSGVDNVSKYDNRVLIYWLNVLSGGSVTIETVCEALEDAIVLQSLNSVKFFWPKLDSHQRLTVVLRSAARLNEMEPCPRPTVMAFIFSQLNDAQAFQFVQVAQNSHSNAAVNLIKALLRRENCELGQRLIKVGIIRQLVPTHGFLRLLYMATCGNWSADDFCIIWLCSSQEQKDFAIANWQLAVILTKLLRLQYYNGTKLLLNYIQNRSELTEQLIFTGPTANLIWHLSTDNNWMWIDYFLCSWMPKTVQSPLRFKFCLGWDQLTAKHPDICRILDKHLRQWVIEILPKDN